MIRMRSTLDSTCFLFLSAAAPKGKGRKEGRGGRQPLEGDKVRRIINFIATQFPRESATGAPHAGPVFR